MIEPKYIERGCQILKDGKVMHLYQIVADLEYWMSRAVESEQGERVIDKRWERLKYLARERNTEIVHRSIGTYSKLINLIEEIENPAPR